MRYNYKYAMPVDPRVLEEDFESTDIDSIPELLALLKETNLSNYESSIERIRILTNRLWFFISSFHRGVNLRDREKLIPVFQEYSRIFRKYENRYSKVYRGMTLPCVYFKFLTEHLGTPKANTKVDLRKHPEVKKVLEGLSYGLRSYSKSEDEGYAWAYGEQYPEEISPDAILLIYNQPNIIFDCDAYFTVVGEDYDAMDESERPFDPEEVLCYLENPKIISIKRELSIGDQSASLWVVEVM